MPTKFCNIQRSALFVCRKCPLSLKEKSAFEVSSSPKFEMLLREQSFLKLGTGVEEFLEGCQIILPCLIGVSNIFAEITKYMMACEIFGIYV